MIEDLRNIAAHMLECDTEDLPERLDKALARAAVYCRRFPRTNPDVPLVAGIIAAWELAKHPG